MLTTKQYQDIKQLQQQCEVHGHFQLKLNDDMLRNRESGQLDFFHYENGELIAFLGLYPFGSEVEVCGMVKQDERRKGHYSRLFHQAMDTTVKAEGYKSILLNAPASSESGKAFLLHVNAAYAKSEYQMEWQQQPLPEVAGVTLRPATPEDWELRLRLNMEAFGDSAEDAPEVEAMIDRDPGSKMFMIDTNGITVGKIRLSLEGESQAWIFGFSILPEHQGKGIGRKALQQVVREQSSIGRTVHLEVETKNDNALGLYQSVGFQAVHAQDYYTYLQK